ncbi:MAG: helix-turn-helix transcriptional regulator [Desulforhopalus sp.]
MKKPMTPGEIRKAISDAGYNQVEIADDCEVSKSFVSQVIRGNATSHRVREYIAKIIKRPVDEVWQIKKNPTKPGPKGF